MAEPAEVFDPASLRVRLRAMRGGDYLDVKWRLVWLREEHPDAIIETEEKGHDPGKWATFRACVSIPNAGVATGHGSETAGDFGDYYEKAETKALGRALAALGYGAQFLPDDDEALADSPVDRKPGPPPMTKLHPPAAQRPASTSQPASAGELITDNQIKFLWSLAREQGVSDDDLKAELWQRYEKDSTKTLTKSEASTVIDWLNGARESAPATPGDTGDPNAWSTIWKELRAVGITTTDAATDFIGFWDGADPAAILTALRAKAATMPGMPAATGTAGADRFTG